MILSERFTELDVTALGSVLVTLSQTKQFSASSRSFGPIVTVKDQYRCIMTLLRGPIKLDRSSSRN